MRLFRCFTDQQMEAGLEITLDAGEHRHLAAVRRARPGYHVLMVNGRGSEFSGSVSRMDRKESRIRLLEEIRREPPPKPERRLAMAMIKADEMIPHAVELGATAIEPFEAARSVLGSEKADEKRERWRRLAIEALKQCERLWLPEIGRVKTLGEVLSENQVQTVWLSERSEAPFLGDLTGDWRNRDLRFLVGPEGGWTDEEKAMLADSKALPASLGRAILRSETAALAALAIALVP